MNELKDLFNPISKMIIFLHVIGSLARYAILHIAPIGLFKIKKNKSAIFFSLTTTPSRINKIGPTLKSLIHQSEKAQGIIVNIPIKSLNGEEYEIPNFLSNHPSITIHRCEDYGPATKLLPTLKKLKDEVVDIIVLDDDQVYPYHLVRDYKEIKKINKGCALGLCGWKAPENFQHEDRKVLLAAGIRLNRPYPNIKKQKEVDILQGASSYMVRPSFFSEEVFRLTESAFFADDIWFSGQLAKGKVKKIIAPVSSTFCRLANANRPLDKVSLKKTVNHDNKYNNELYRFFKNYWINESAN